MRREDEVRKEGKVRRIRKRREEEDKEEEKEGTREKQRRVGRRKRRGNGQCCDLAVNSYHLITLPCYVSCVYLLCLPACLRACWVCNDFSHMPSGSPCCLLPVGSRRVAEPIRVARHHLCRHYSGHFSGVLVSE